MTEAELRRGREAERGRQTVSKLVFYAQSIDRQ